MPGTRCPWSSRRTGLEIFFINATHFAARTHHSVRDLEHFAMRRNIHTAPLLANNALPPLRVTYQTACLNMCIVILSQRSSPTVSSRASLAACCGEKRGLLHASP